MYWYFLLTSIFGVVLFLIPISLIAYILVNIRKKKNKSFKILGEQEESEAEQIFVEHRGIKIPIRRRELPMWNKMHREDKNELLATFLRISKKGKIFKDTDGKGWKKLVRVK